MRYARVFLLHLQDALDDKGRMFVWFLISLINPLVLLLFWRGAPGVWSVSDAAAYYVLLVIANTFLSVHIEEVVAHIDIQEGYLSNYLVKPVSYLVYKFFHELPYRVVESVFGLLFLGMFLSLFHLRFGIGDAASVVLFFGIFVLAYGISFLFKMVLGLTALWTTDYAGVAQLVQVVIIVSGGFIMPIALYPPSLQSAIYALPFPYMFYAPVGALLGYFSRGELVRILAIQCAWVVALYALYRFVWKRGVGQFTAIGR